PPPPPPPPPPPAGGPPAALSITNTQVAGVDEGGIVKLRGDIMVILRRGRLFTVSLAGGGMRPVSTIDAFPPGIDGRGDWYDEMLIAGDRVVVIGYSYRRRGSQVNRFRLDAEGRLTFEDSYQLRSNDYYSSRNYASRLIGNRLILYSPLDFKHQGDPLDSLPGMAQWRPGATASPFRRIAAARRVYIPNALRDVRNARLTTLHSVTSCDLAAPVLDCQATVVLGSASRTFFVSGNAVYLWVDSVWKKRRNRAANAFLYRIPFDGGRPSAVQARGSPVDQFSFYPDAPRSALQVVVRADGGGDSMWRPEVTNGNVALVSVPMAAFGSGGDEVPLDRYQSLPLPEGDSWRFHNRFVGDHLLYGAGRFEPGGSVIAVSLADRGVHRLATEHGIDRIDAIGPDAILVGSGRGGLGFSAVRLGGAAPAIGETFMLPDAREGETRSHAFFFRPDRDSADGGSGLLGLPAARFLTVDGYRRNSAAMLFLSRRDGRLALTGELAASTGAGNPSDDGCQASCVDWYGNARPIFIGDRIFALLGYELVEGAVAPRGMRVREVGRTSFAPAAPRPR
ncbi:MAG TPA: beta-propeller domain-containing protein, partial [Allosphingosinicella sp.]|nr:beta-propeller domain-containing protein [Allosphingosinicella sp.]